MKIHEIRSRLTSAGHCSIVSRAFRHVSGQARTEYLDSMRSSALHAPKERMNRRDLADRPWRKLAIGSANGVGESYAQLLQTTYFDEHCGEYPGLRELFSRMVTLRNDVLGVARDFGSVPARDGFWNACRIHHYPRGGSFMAAHRDTYFPKALESAGHPFLQVMVLLSERGRDFRSGGGYIVDRAGNKIQFEHADCLGTVVAFDGGIVHGVEDVDADEIIDFHSPSGRLAAFVNLYKVLDGDAG